MTPGWYDENRYRDYPFIHGTIGLPGGGQAINCPREAVLDCGLMFGPLAGFLPGTHSVWLQSIERTATALVFRLQTDAPALEGVELEFSALIADLERGLTIWNDGETILEAVSASGSLCVESADWSGFLVIGETTALLAALSVDEVWEGPVATALLEPVCTQSLAGQMVTQIHLVNLDRTRASSPADCRALCYPRDPGLVHVNATCLQGDVQLQAGYNCQIVQDDGSNTLTIHAAVGGGKGEPCEEVPVYSGETPPTGRAALDGSLLCSEVVRLLGGVAGPVVNLLIGDGVTLLQDPDDHRLIIDVDLHNITATQTTAIPQNESACPSSSAEDDNSCDCGDS